MSRSGYSEDLDCWSSIRWRGAVNSATKGKRGQAFLKELLAALNAMPEKKLITDELEYRGEFCALGVIGYSRGIDMSKIDPHESTQLSRVFNIAAALAKEIVYMNDDAGIWYEETPASRWERMHRWIASQIMPNSHLDNNEE